MEQGIILAIVLSLIDHTRHGYRPKNVVLVPAKSSVWHETPVVTRVSYTARQEVAAVLSVFD